MKQATLRPLRALCLAAAFALAGCATLPVPVAVIEPKAGEHSALKAMKALTVKQLEFREGIKHDDVDALVQAAMKSQDAQEGMKARLEKRTAKFQGK